MLYRSPAKPDVFSETDMQSSRVQIIHVLNRSFVKYFKSSLQVFRRATVYLVCYIHFRLIFLKCCHSFMNCFVHGTGLIIVLLIAVFSQIEDITLLRLYHS